MLQILRILQKTTSLAAFSSYAKGDFDKNVVKYSDVGLFYNARRSPLAAAVANFGSGAAKSQRFLFFCTRFMGVWELTLAFWKSREILGNSFREKRCLFFRSADKKPTSARLRQ